MATLTAVEEGLVAWIHWAIVAVFTALVAWRLAGGGLRRGLGEARAALGSAAAAGVWAVLGWSGRRG